MAEADGFNGNAVTDIRALSIRQPWAFAIVKGYKPVENRKWRTEIRGTVLIHASLNEDKRNLGWVLKKIAEQASLPLGVVSETYQMHLESGAVGAIVGSADITDCVTSMSNSWFFGQFGFVLANAKLCRPISCRGALGFFRPAPPIVHEARLAGILPRETLKAPTP